MESEERERKEVREGETNNNIYYLKLNDYRNHSLTHSLTNSLNMTSLLSIIQFKNPTTNQIRGEYIKVPI